MGAGSTDAPRGSWGLPGGRGALLARPSANPRLLTVGCSTGLWPVVQNIDCALQASSPTPWVKRRGLDVLYRGHPSEPSGRRCQGEVAYCGATGACGHVPIVTVPSLSNRSHGRRRHYMGSQKDKSLPLCPWMLVAPEAPGQGRQLRAPSLNPRRGIALPSRSKEVPCSRRATSRHRCLSLLLTGRSFSRGRS